MKRMDIRLALVCVSIIAIGFIFTAPGKAQIDPGTAAGIWLLDEDDGDEARDSSENGNHGTIQGAEWVTGQFGSALSFNGQDARGVIPASDSLDLQEAWTITAWIFVNESEADYGHILGKRSSVANYAFRINNVGTGWDTYFMRDGVWQGIWGQGSVKRGEWYYMTSVYDGEGPITIYENGVQIGTGNIGPPPPAGTAEVHLGGWQGNASELLDGTLDEVVLFSAALTPENIIDLMENGTEKALKMVAVNRSGKLIATWANIKNR